MDKWSRKLRKEKIKLVFSLLALLGCLVSVGRSVYCWWDYNKRCDEACIAAGHPAGEHIPWMKHAACECFTKQPSAPVRMLLERDD